MSLTPDDERTLQVLESVDDCEPPACDNWTRLSLHVRGLLADFRVAQPCAEDAGGRTDANSLWRGSR